jgi:hypothetical protein
LPVDGNQGFAPAVLEDTQSMRRRWVVAVIGSAVLTGGCKAEKPATPASGPMPAAATREVTFFAFGDPQYGGGPGDKNAFHIQALNAGPELLWPTGFSRAGAPVGEPRGVIIAGDLTQNGQSGRDPAEWYTAERYLFDLNRHYGVNVEQPRISGELGLFLNDYGLAGNDGRNAFVLRWPVFEGYGNHDFDVLEYQAALYGGAAPARDVVAIRNQVRRSWQEFRRMAPGSSGHYSWDWDDVHMVQLNVAGADAATPLQQPRDPMGALGFLQQDLDAEVGDSCRPVIVVMHYGFDPFSSEERWWDAEQRRAFLAALARYNVVAILHGHLHQTRIYQVLDEDGRAFPVFALGSPFYSSETNAGRGHFAVFRLSGGRIEAADVSWLPANPMPALSDGLDLWTGKQLADVAFQTTTTFPGGWGGWRFEKAIDPNCPPRSLQR